MERSIIRLLTCGSVDDGKSTLIGRLLVETDSIPHDTIDSTRNVRRSGSTIAAGEIDFSLLTDGLEAEREQGITIDVAYRSMSLLDGKRLIISDAPGHEQYTRNMAVAASRADIALVLVDATKGVRTQTLRHLTICSLMGISRVIVAINKLDAMNYSQSVFEEIRGNVQTALTRMHLDDVLFIPLSALAGDNVVQGSKNMGWYEGQTLLESIQDWRPAEAIDTSARMRIQLISRAENFRGVSGTVHRGTFNTGDEVKIFPSNQSATIAKIITYKKEIQSAHDSDAVTLLLEPEVDATRGDLIAAAKEELHPSDRFNADIVWLHEDPLIHSRSYLLIAGSSQTPATVTRIRHKIDVNSGSLVRENSIENTALKTNLEAAKAVADHLRLRDIGGLIVVDFIDMDDLSNRKKVEMKMKDEICAKDKARVQFTTISPFGLMEVSRQRLRTGFIDVSTNNCSHCYGTGRIFLALFPTSNIISCIVLTIYKYLFFIRFIKIKKK
jgi:bifunctional enzyme CysN/CysC